MRNVYTEVAVGSWIVVGLVWLTGYFFTKPTRAKPERSRQLVASLFLASGGVMFFYAANHGPVLSIRVPPQAPQFRQIGLVFDLVGVGFAIWARGVLGRNWSNVMTLKQGHELVRNGPYRLVRHPIYAGFFLAVLGTAMTMGLLGAYLGAIFLLIGYLIRIQSEDALMARQFPDTYPAWRAQTRALIPYVW